MFECTLIGEFLEEGVVTERADSLEEAVRRAYRRRLKIDDADDADLICTSPDDEDLQQGAAPKDCDGDFFIVYEKSLRMTCPLGTARRIKAR
jgi:hypothetical protein